MQDHHGHPVDLLQNSLFAKCELILIISAVLYLSNHVGRSRIFALGKVLVVFEQALGAVAAVGHGAGVVEAHHLEIE